MADPSVALNAGILPPAGLPPELATQLSQLQIRQQLAEALLAKSLQDVPSTTPGPSGNPYAHDTVNIGGMLNRMINARTGREQLDQIMPQEMALAQRGEAIRQQDMAGVMQDVMGGETPGPYPSGSINKQSDVLAGIARALRSSHPAVQAQGQALQKAWIEGQMKGIPTAGDIAAFGRNYTPRSTASSISPGLFGPMVDPSKLESLPAILQGTGPITTVEKVPGAIGKSAGIATVPPQPIVGPDEGSPPSIPGAIPPANTAGAAVPLPTAAGPRPSETGGGSVTWNPLTGKPEVLETPATKAATKIADEKIVELGKGREASQAYMENLPKLTTMISLIPNSDLRFGGEQITKIRMLATSLGVSKDDANKIVDTQTFLKLALPQAAETARAFNSRATQLEFQKFSDAAAANQNIDPRAAKNIIMQAVLDGVNANRQHENNIAQYSGLPAIGAKQAETYRVPHFPTIDSVMRQLDQSGPGTTVKVKVDPETGMLKNEQVGQASQARSEIQWVIRNGKLVPNAPTSP